MNIEIPPDYENQEKHRGFAFIEYELAEDAAAAIDNMVTIRYHLKNNLKDDNKVKSFIE